MRFVDEKQAKKWLRGALAITPAKFKVLWGELAKERVVAGCLDDDESDDLLLAEANRLKRLEIKTKYPHPDVTGGELEDQA